MSKHAKPTLVRFFRGEGNVQYALVRDWRAQDGWANFTLPDTSLIGTLLITDGLLDVRVVVMESEEVVWDVNSVRHEVGAIWRVRCQSHALRVRQSQPRDEWLLMTQAVEQ